MKLKFTLRSTGGVDADLVATVDATTTVGQLAEYLASADPARASAQVPDAQGQLTLSLVDEDFRAVDPRATIAESGLRSGVHVAVTRRSDGYVDRGRAVAQATVVSGPDTGRQVPLSPGTAYIGRGRGSEFQLTDPQVSRRHAKLLVTDQAEVVDLGSSNGILFEGQPVDRAVLHSGDGSAWGTPRSRTHALGTVTGLSSARGTSVPFSRSPRVAPLYAGREFSLPELPTRPGKERPPWIAATAPLLMGVVLASVLHNPTFLLFILLTPAMLFAHYFEAKRHARQDYEEQLAEFREDAGIIIDELKAEQAREVAGQAGRAPHRSRGPRRGPRRLSAAVVPSAR